VLVRGAGAGGSAHAVAEGTRRRLLEWHSKFSRFDPASELSRLNRDPRSCVPVSPIMARFVRACVRAAAISGGLVDPTLVGELERVGYAGDLSTLVPPTGEEVAPAPAPTPAAPSRSARWRHVLVDSNRGKVSRPVGVQLDSGGVAKGMFGDVLATALRWHRSFAVDLAGDIVFGGTDREARELRVASPFNHEILHTFELTGGAVATSGITRRCWVDGHGRIAHHLLDPSTGRPACTGIVQATALAPSGVEAETLAKAALLAGPDQATDWLRHGGVLVYPDGACQVIEPHASSALR
jgi:FAD:protein FMN transferase